MATLSHQQDGPIKTQRLLLRGAQESDLEPLHEIFSDEEVMRYWYLPNSPIPYPSIAEKKQFQVLCPSHNHGKDVEIPPRHDGFVHQRNSRLRHRTCLITLINIPSRRRPTPERFRREGDRQSRHLEPSKLRDWLHAEPRLLEKGLYG